MNIRLIDGRRIEFFGSNGLTTAISTLYGEGSSLRLTSSLLLDGGLSLTGDLSFGDANRKIVLGSGSTDTTLTIENSGIGVANLVVEGSVTALNFLGSVEGIDVSDLLALVNTHIANMTTHVTSDEKVALAGTNGTPGGTNKFVTNSDPRLTDSRTPLVHGDEKHNALSYFDIITDGTNITNASTTLQSIRFAGGNGATASVATVGNEAVVTFNSFRPSISRDSITIPSGGVAQGSTIGLPTVDYVVGNNGLMVFMGNIVLAKDVDYMEVGVAGASSDSIRVLADIPEGTVLTFLVFNI